MGGGLGSCARYGIARLFGSLDTSFPLATSLANLFACALLGYGIVLAAQSKISEAQKLLLLTGFCGGFSTFSTFSAEVVQLWTEGRLAMAVLYVFISLMGGFATLFWLTK